MEYLPWRGITAENFQRYEAKTRVSPDGEPLALSLPYPNGSVKLRSRSEKKFWMEGTPEPSLFGQDKFDPGESRYVIITEGELDALSCYQMLEIPAVSVRSSSSAVRDVAACRSWLSGFERVYLCFDSDVAGREATRACAQLFDRDRTYDVRLVRRKDANEYLQAGDELEFRRVWHAAKHYMPDSIVSDIGTFKNLLQEEPKLGVPYPYPTLTDMTYGIRTGEFVLITAKEGVGKSSMLRQIEHKLLTETTANVGVLFPEETRRQHLQYLVGLQMGVPVHLPGSSIDATVQAGKLDEMLGRDDRLFVLSNDWGQSPSDLADSIRLLVAGFDCRYILVDLLNHNWGSAAGEDERKQIDYLSTVLSLMAVELDFSLIGTAHVNDNGDTRGSRYLAKTASVRIDLTRDLDSGSTLTDVTVRKNRYAAKTGPAGTLRFDPRTYRLEEVREGADKRAPIPANDNVDTGQRSYAA